MKHAHKMSKVQLIVALRLVYKYPYIMASFLDALCKTTRTGDWENGKECVFSFKWKDVPYDNCTTADWHDPWCSTENDANGNMAKWGKCDNGCLGRFVQQSIVPR